MLWARISGSTYVNDFNKFGRTWQVKVQADSMFRSKPEDIGRLQVRNSSGKMVPLGAMSRVDYTLGPLKVESGTTSIPQQRSWGVRLQDSAVVRR